MPITIRSGGTNRAIRGVTVRSGGTNRTIKAVYVRSGGVNRLVFAAVNLVGLDPIAVTISPADASANYTLTSGGLEQATGSANSTWLLAGAAADYEVRATVTSGTLTSGTTGSWLSLGSTRTWNVTRTSDLAGSTTATMTVEIRLAATGVVIASATVQFTATVDV